MKNSTAMEVEEEKEKNYWLPIELTTEILSRLPVDSVLQFKSVCKTWQALLSDPKFYDIHLQQSLRLRNCRTHDNIFLSVDTRAKNQFEFLEYNVDGDHDYLRVINGIAVENRNFEVVGSCNGLLCLRIGNLVIRDRITKYITSVYNPVTREYAIIPSGPGFSSSTENHKKLGCFCPFTYLGSGFGYHSLKHEYKIVMTYRSCDPLENSQIYVGIYTLGSGKWRRKVIPDSVSASVCNTAKAKASVQLSGCLHWLTDVPELVSFDLAHEEFKVTSTEIISPKSMHQFGLLGGSLCVAAYHDHYWDRLEISLMNLEGSCTRKFTVKCHNPNLRPIELLENGKIIMRLNSTQFVVYDPKDESFAGVDIIGNSFESPTEQPRMYNNITPYMRSFVSLKALGETSWVDVLRRK